MRLPMFLAVAAAAVVTFVSPAQQLYNEPTFSQAERLIGAVQEAGGDPAAYTAAVARAARSLYNKPTFSQVERLISEVRANGASGASDMAELHTNVADVVSALTVATNDIATIKDALAPSNMSVRIAQSTGIHIGEEAVVTQFIDGVWATTGTVVSAVKTVEIGYNARAPEVSDSNQAIAIGRDSLSAGAATVAVGPNSFAEGAQSVAVGWRANAVGEHSVSIGSAKKAHENYYTTNGTVNASSDLQLASGDYSTAVGFNNKATGDSSVAIGNEAFASGLSAIAVGRFAAAATNNTVQLGTGTNSVPHTLKFEDVTIVKDGRVVGSAPDPEELMPDSGEYGSLTLSVDPGALVAVLPDAPLTAASEVTVECSGMRNYTMYLPNEPEVRNGLPFSLQFDLPDGVRHAVSGSSLVTRLPCRVVAEQPYRRLSVLNVIELDDGYDWTPSVTNCAIAYNLLEGRFFCTNPAPSLAMWSLQGTSLHCATEFTLSYPLGGGGTNTVDLLTVPEGHQTIPGTVYGYAPRVDYAVPGDMAPDVSSDRFTAVIRYKTIHGTAEYIADIDVVGVEN